MKLLSAMQSNQAKETLQAWKSSKNVKLLLNKGGVIMGRKILNEDEKAVRITITIDAKTAEQVEQYAKMEMLPISRLIARILKRYFDMK